MFQCEIDHAGVEESAGGWDDDDVGGIGPGSPPCHFNEARRASMASSMRSVVLSVIANAPGKDGQVVSSIPHLQQSKSPHLFQSVDPACAIVRT